jgi:hypothetical protein
MRFYTAHLRIDREPILIREGFSWGAAVFGALWLFVHGAWIAGVLALVADLLIGLLPKPFGIAGGFCLCWLLGLFGNDLRRWNLGLLGYAMPHIIAARDLTAADARLLGARPDLQDRMA